MFKKLHFNANLELYSADVIVISPTITISSTYSFPVISTILLRIFCSNTGLETYNNHASRYTV